MDGVPVTSVCLGGILDEFLVMAKLRQGLALGFYLGYG